RWLGELVAVLLVSFLLDRLLRLGVTTRLVLLLLGTVYLLVDLWRFVIVPWRIQVGLVGLAAAIDRTGSEKIRGSLAARVASVLELPALLAGPGATAARRPTPSRCAIAKATAPAPPSQ